MTSHFTKGDTVHETATAGVLPISLFRTKNIDAMLAVARDDGLKKVLGPADLVMMGIGAIVGTGIFVLTGTGAVTAGPALTVLFLIAAVVCGFAAIAAFVPLNVLAELINIGTLAAFSLVSIAVLVLRRTRPDLPRAFRCPGGAVVPVLSVVFCVFLMAHLQALTWTAFLVWLVLGLVIYFLYARCNAVLHNHGG